LPATRSLALFAAPLLLPSPLSFPLSHGTVVDSARDVLVTSAAHQQMQRWALPKLIARQ
jgi:hypothetical protein